MFIFIFLIATYYVNFSQGYDIMFLSFFQIFGRKTEKKTILTA